VAVTLGKEPFIKLFLDGGASPEIKDGWGRTALLSALDNIYDEGGGLKRGVSHENTVRLLLDAGADPNPPTASRTPLQLVAEYHNIIVLKMLLDAKSDVNTVGEDNAVIADIRYERQMYREGHSQEEYRFYLEEDIRERGTRDNYDTPHRILSERCNLDKQGTSNTRPLKKCSPG
jgi:hypothetical protein